MYMMEKYNFSFQLIFTFIFTFCNQVEKNLVCFIFSQEELACCESARIVAVFTISFRSRFCASLKTAMHLSKMRNTLCSGMKLKFIYSEKATKCCEICRFDCYYIVDAVGSSEILKGKQNLGVTFNFDKQNVIDFTKFSKMTMCRASEANS